jgi:hypothetical protein
MKNKNFDDFEVEDEEESESDFESEELVFNDRGLINKDFNKKEM